MEEIGFIGLGIMGASMAGHLISPQTNLTVYSRTKARAEPLLARGATWAGSPAEVAARATTVFICVPDSPDVEQVVRGGGGILSTIKKGSIVVDHSTISPAVTRELNEALSAKGAIFFDAPVSGGDIGARNATLSIMVGGDESHFPLVRPLLEHMGKTITFCGSSGAGQLTKLVNQILVTVNNLAVCEALVFARENGLNLQKTIAAVGGGAAGSWQLTNLGPKMVAGDFKPGFMIKLQQKDLRLAMEAAASRGLHLSALEEVSRLFDEAMKEGRAGEGTQALYAIVTENAVREGGARSVR